MVDEARDAPGAGDAADAHGAGGAPEAGDAPDQEELQRRLEEQLRQIRVQDLLLESVASILNLAARRIGKEDERDLEQARIGIDAVRAVVDLLDEAPREQVREALAQVQMLYVRETKGAEAAGGPGAAPRPAARPRPRRPSRRHGCGPPVRPESGSLAKTSDPDPAPPRVHAIRRQSSTVPAASRPDRSRPLLTEKTLTEDLT